MPAIVDAHAMLVEADNKAVTAALLAARGRAAWDAPPELDVRNAAELHARLFSKVVGEYYNAHVLVAFRVALELDRVRGTKLLERAIEATATVELASREGRLHDALLATQFASTDGDRAKLLLATFAPHCPDPSAACTLGTVIASGPITLPVLRARLKALASGTQAQERGALLAVAYAMMRRGRHHADEVEKLADAHDDPEIADALRQAATLR